MVLRMFHGQSAVVPLGLPGEEPDLPAESGEVLDFGCCCGLLLPNRVGDGYEGPQSALICRRSPSLVGGTLDSCRY